MLCCEPGRRTVKIEPLPASLVTLTSPPIMRASLRVMASPRPVPPKRRAVEESAWVNSSNSFACCSGVMPMPVSATANSTTLWPSTRRGATVRVTSPFLVNLQALLSRLSRICRRRIGSTVIGAEVGGTFHHETVAVLLRELARGADDLVDQRRDADGLRAELELAGFDLGEIEHLVDQAEQMRAGAVHPPQRLERLLGAEARRIRDHHLGEPDDGVERRAQLVAHIGEELRLVLARDFELPALFLDLREQIGVLDRQHRLRRKGLQQLDRVARKLAGRLASDDQRAERPRRGG